MKINAQYLELKDSYLFATVNRKVREYQAAHPDKKVIKLGIGDVTIPLCGAVTEAMHKAGVLFSEISVAGLLWETQCKIGCR